MGTACRVQLCATAECNSALLPLVFLALLFGCAVLAGAAETSGFRFVDLSTAAVASDASARQFSMLPAGAQTFHGVPFQISSRLAVTGIESARAGEFFPTEVTGIKGSGQSKRLHLLHGTMFADKDGVPVAKIVFHYANGGEEAVRLGYGVHVRAWITPRLEKRAGLLDPNSQVAWADADERRGAASRIFQTAIENPHPAEAVTSVDVVSLFSHAAPFILALSVEEKESALAPNRPLPARKPVRELREFADSVYRGEITVRVTDGPSGAPPKNAVVSLGVTDDKETFFFGEARPDAQGVCRMPYPPQHAVGLSVWVHAPDRAPVIVSESKTNLAKFSGEYAVTLQPGVMVGGLVKDAGGKPIAAAQVSIHKITRLSPHHYSRVDYDVALTGADGKWTSRSLPDNLNGLSFQVTHPDYRAMLFVTQGFAPPPTNSSTTTTIRTTTRQPAEVTYRRQPDGTLVPINTVRVPFAGPPGIPLVTTNALLAGSAEMTLPSAVLVEGTLVDTQSKPVPAAEVILVRSNVGERKYLQTDAQGHFQARLGEPGDAAVIVVRDGFAPLFQHIMVTPGLAPLVVKLAPPHVLRGHVQDQKANPVSGARVRLDAWNSTSDLLKFQALTDEQGAFVWSNAPSDQLTFFVSKTNFSSTRHSFGGAMSEIVIPISRAPGVYGKVYDAETKKPVEAFTIIPGRKYSQGETQIHWDRSDIGRGYGGEYLLRVSSYYFQPEGYVLVEAPGYEPQISRPLTGVDSYVCDFALKKGRGIAGVVQWPDGSPAVSAALLLAERGEYASLGVGGVLRGNGGSGDLIRSDAQGRFEFPAKLEPSKIFVSHDEGFAEATVSNVLQGGKIILQKWGRVKGVMLVGDKGETDAALLLQSQPESYGNADGRAAVLSVSQKADAEADGGFLFEKVPPGEHRLALEYRFKDERNGDLALSHGFPVTVKAGETTDATLGGTGRRVTGRVKILGGDQSDVDWKRDVHRLVLNLPDAANARAAAQPRPLIFLGGFNPVANQPMTVEAMRARQRAERMYVLLVDTNGNFRADNIPPGTYNLSLNVTDPEDEYYNRRSIGALNQPVTIPDEPNAKVNAPFDLGALELTIRPRLKLGRAVPSFDAKTAEGKTIKLSDLRGKWVLLNFWGLSLGYNSYDMTVLKEFQASHGTAGKLVILGCNLDADTKNAAQFAKNQGMTWTQVYLGQWDQTPVPGMFGLNGNSGSVLIDPEGRLASAPLRGTAVRNALANALATE